MRRTPGIALALVLLAGFVQLGLPQVAHACQGNCGASLLTAPAGYVDQFGTRPSNQPGSDGTKGSLPPPPPTYNIGDFCPPDSWMTNVSWHFGPDDAGWYLELPASVSGPSGGSYTATASLWGQTFTTTIPSVAQANQQAVADLQALGFQVDPNTQFFTLDKPMQGESAYAELVNEWTVNIDLKINKSVWSYTRDGTTYDGSPGHDIAAYKAKYGTDPPDTSPPLVCNFTATTLGASIDTQQSNVTVTSTPTVGPQIDSILATWHPGTVATLPSAGNRDYVRIPTCSWLSGGNLPTQPTPVTAGSMVVPASGFRGWQNMATVYWWSVVYPGAVQWDFADPSGDTSVHGQGSPGAPNSGTPQYDPVSGTWPNADAVCDVHHEYRQVTPGSSQIQVTAKRSYTVYVCYAYHNGTSVTSFNLPAGGGYCQVYATPTFVWKSAPFSVEQIQGVPVFPAG